MSDDIIELNIQSLDGEPDTDYAFAILYVYRALDCSETETEVVVRFDYSPEEKPEYQDGLMVYPGCGSMVTINEVYYQPNGNRYNCDLIDNILDAEEEIKNLVERGE